MCDGLGFFALALQEGDAADCAEWLIKSVSFSDFISGEIVGIHQGSIKYQTEEAEQLMVVSRMPIILGNMPQYGKESEYEKVVFMGQVPVFVLELKMGDFILSSVGNNGLGIAKFSQIIWVHKMIRISLKLLGLKVVFQHWLIQ